MRSSSTIRPVPVRVSKTSRSESLRQQGKSKARVKVVKVHSLTSGRVVPKNEPVEVSVHNETQELNRSSRQSVKCQEMDNVETHDMDRTNHNRSINTSFNLSILSQPETNEGSRIRHQRTPSHAIPHGTKEQCLPTNASNTDEGDIAPKSSKRKETDPMKSYAQKEGDNWIGNQRRRRKAGAMGRFCCSPCCCALTLLGILLLLAAIAALVLGLLTRNVNTTSSTSTTTTTTTVTTTSTATTTTTTTTSTSSSTSTSTTTTTTTTYYCGASCLYQSWFNPTGGLAFWPFENTYLDVVGSYHGYSSSRLPSFVTGVFGQAAFFNESAQQAIFTPYIPLRNVSFTVEAWINPRGYPNPTDFSIVGLCPSQTTNFCLHINIRNTKLYFGFYFNDVQGGTTIQLNRWIHTAFVFDASTRIMTIYLNGVVDGQGSVSSSLLVQSGNFTIGTNEGVVIPDNYFHGVIDQLSINRRAKPACEILEIATLAAHFKFDLPTPTLDSSPNTINTTMSSTSTIALGRLSQALAFSGASSSYFQGSGLTSLGFNNQPFSISLWIQPQLLSGTLVHLSSSPNGVGTNCFPLLGFSSTGAIIAQVLTATATLATATGPILPISSSAWVPIAQTWSATNGLRLYVNGTLTNSVAASTFLGSGTTPNYLTLGGCLSGCMACSNGQIGVPGPYTGALDDVRVYLRELSSIDVCTLLATA